MPMNFPKPAVGMLPTDRLAYSAIPKRKPLKLPKGARMVVGTVTNVEDWDPDHAAHGVDAAGRRLADAGHPELVLARIRQPGRLLAAVAGL
jgi:hypothetical protein